MGTKKDTEKKTEKKTEAGKGEFTGFKRGYTIYMLCLLAALAVGLIVLWMRMEAYEKSRPDKALDQYIAAAGDSAYWRGMLLEKGVEEAYVDTLDLADVSFRKRLGVYTDDVPVYSVCFGDVEMISVELAKGGQVGFGYNEWEIGDVSLSGSRLCVYVPWDAVVRVDGKDVGKDFPVQENAKELQLGIFDANAKDIRGLSKYELGTVYMADRVAVEDKDGRAFELSHASGSSYYYAPFMSDYKITAPTGCNVTVNGIALTSENAKLEESPLEDFEGMEEYVKTVPRQTIYTVEGLIMQPEIEVRDADGDIIEGSADGTVYRYDVPQEELTKELSDYISTVFDAYIAYSGGRGGNLIGNYNRYISYAVPDSEVVERATRAQESIQWISGKDKKLKGSKIAKYTPYSDELFTAQIDFTLDGDNAENANSYLLVFVKYKGAWKLGNILNKTSYAIG